MKTINQITAQTLHICELAVTLYHASNRARYARTLAKVQAIATKYQRNIIDAVGPVNKPQPRAIYAA